MRSRCGFWRLEREMGCSCRKADFRPGGSGEADCDDVSFIARRRSSIPTQDEFATVRSP